jgi:uncharacterized protein YndB with AHSA1/START domain
MCNLMVAPLDPEFIDVDPAEAVVETRRVMRRSPDDVWHRLVTEPGLWLGPGARLDPVPGGRVSFGDHRGVILDVEAPRRLSWEWSADGDPGWSTVELSIDEAEGETVVTVVERLMRWEFESFPAQGAGGPAGSVIGACAP